MDILHYENKKPTILEENINVKVIIMRHNCILNTLDNIEVLQKYHKDRKSARLCNMHSLRSGNGG